MDGAAPAGGMDERGTDRSRGPLLLSPARPHRLGQRIRVAHSRLDSSKPFPLGASRPPRRASTCPHRPQPPSTTRERRFSYGPTRSVIRRSKPPVRPPRGGLSPRLFLGSRGLSPLPGVVSCRAPPSSHRPRTRDPGRRWRARSPLRLAERHGVVLPSRANEQARGARSLLWGRALRQAGCVVLGVREDSTSCPESRCEVFLLASSTSASAATKATAPRPHRGRLAVRGFRDPAGPGELGVPVHGAVCLTAAVR